MFEQSEKLSMVVFLSFIIGGVIGIIVGILLVPSHDEGAISMGEYYNRQILDARVNCYKIQAVNGRPAELCEDIMPLGDYPDQI